MGTRSHIYVKLNDTEYGYIYAHWDGYPSWRGKLLLGSYKTWSKCKSLVKLGNLSSLQAKIRPNKKKGEHTFENPQKDVTVFYGRDRGEKGQEMQILQAITVQEACEQARKQLEGDVFIEYLYFHDGAGWWIAEPHEWKFEKLETVMQMEKPDAWKYGPEED